MKDWGFCPEQGKYKLVMKNQESLFSENSQPVTCSEVYHGVSDPETW